MIGDCYSDFKAALFRVLLTAGQRYIALPSAAQRCPVLGISVKEPRAILGKANERKTKGKWIGCKIADIQRNQSSKPGEMRFLEFWNLGRIFGVLNLMKMDYFLSDLRKLSCAELRKTRASCFKQEKKFQILYRRTLGHAKISPRENTFPSTTSSGFHFRYKCVFCFRVNSLFERFTLQRLKPLRLFYKAESLVNDSKSWKLN